MNTRTARYSSAGFSIIEIMVATLLLATVLVSIYGAQFSAVKSSVYVRNITMATELSRCKMSELELLFIEEGFQEGDITESGTCCEFLDNDEFPVEFDCEWEIKTVVFPDASEMISADNLSDESITEMGFGEESGMGDLFGGGMGGMDGMDGMAEMGLGQLETLLPVLTDLLEQAIRRVTVRVAWEEGNVTKDFEIVQYVTHPSQGPLKALQQASQVNSAMEDMGIPLGGGQGGSGGSSGERAR